MIEPMARRWSPRRAGAALLATSLVLSGCSDDDAAPASDRACAVVQADELSDIVDADVVLQDPEEGDRACRFTDEAGSVEVLLTVDSPVETDLAELILDEPEPVDDLGDAAFASREGVPLDVRVVARVGGSMVTVDLGAPQQTRRARLALATEIAEAALDDLPEADPVEAEGERGDEACERYGADEVVEALGGVPTIEPIAPPGSCAIGLDVADLEIRVTVLLEGGADAAQLEALVSAIDTDVEATVGDASARWVPSQADGAGGQLNVLDDDRILQVAVVADGMADAEALALATEIAAVAIS